MFNLYADQRCCLATSAGTAPAGHVHPEVVEVMQEIGIDLRSVKPQRLIHNAHSGHPGGHQSIGLFTVDGKPGEPDGTTVLWRQTGGCSGPDREHS
jgi:hypothetical protein